MQVKVTLYAKKELIIPLNYNHALQSSIYDVLGADPEYAEFIHDKGFNSFRMFTFGGLKGKYTLSGGKMLMRGNVSFEVRSPSEKFCEIFEHSLLTRDTMTLVGSDLEIRRVELTDIRVTQNTVHIATASPITARFNLPDGSTIYYSPEQNEFSELLRSNISAKYSAYTGNKDESFNFCCTGNSRKIVTRYKSIWVTAYHLTAELTGTPELLDLAYQAGLGSRSAQGFGMFDLV